MARKKIVPEEEVSKPVMAEEITAGNADNAAPVSYTHLRAHET